MLGADDSAHIEIKREPTRHGKFMFKNDLYKLNIIYDKSKVNHAHGEMKNSLITWRSKTSNKVLLPICNVNQLVFRSQLLLVLYIQMYAYVYKHT